ncbi:hypothetical protein K505DRAFT_367839 [Melanomma pulvis-pyrius CBS 109.77]|uniref:N-acetyltransferase domain-containing protein n=1 Tax=Melanomma pulvis-pyrius CBS 109.77 TaxID=1314802 RepID=A0A6A6WSG8_9PLEO|nr:hypothetical protein K505DRAFT_367839 [Melanomma pulvis-pyrius CBS 109.77]
MKLNEHTALLTPKILLVPYSTHHVPTYHTWMQSAELQKATASEPLTLAEEHSMQQSWREDADKLTFICCVAPPSTPTAVTTNPDQTHQPTTIEEGKSNEVEDAESRLIESRNHDAPDAMIGDVNLFLCVDEDSLSDDDDDNDIAPPSGPTTASPTPQVLVGEVEIMIAVPSYQNRGLGQQILLTFLWYITTSLPQIVHEYHARHSSGKSSSYLKYLRVKISAENVRSIKLFEKVGFTKVNEQPNYFGELELRWPLSAASTSEIEVKMDTIPLIAAYR